MAKNAKSAAMSIDRDKYGYKPTKYADASGKTRYSVGNGDAVQLALLGMDVEAVIKVAKANGLGELVAKHQSNRNINKGQLRMLLGNALRAKVKKGESITVNGLEIKKLDQKVTVAQPKKKAA